MSSLFISRCEGLKRFIVFGLFPCYKIIDGTGSETSEDPQKDPSQREETGERGNPSTGKPFDGEALCPKEVSDDVKRVLDFIRSTHQRLP